MSVVIQCASIDDATAIAEIQISSLSAAYQDQILNDVLFPSDVKQRARHWAGWLKRSRVSTAVARVDGTVTGFCTLHPTRDETAKGTMGEIAALYVIPSHWRRGIGRLLCERTLAEARTRGFAEVVLWVLQSNAHARSFYDSLGFRPDGQMRVFLERSNESLHVLRYRRNTSAEIQAPLGDGSRVK